jgi:hypothetical protein
VNANAAAVQKSVMFDRRHYLATSQRPIAGKSQTALTARSLTPRPTSWPRLRTNPNPSVWSLFPVALCQPAPGTGGYERRHCRLLVAKPKLAHHSSYGFGSPNRSCMMNITWPWANAAAATLWGDRSLMLLGDAVYRPPGPPERP